MISAQTSNLTVRLDAQLKKDAEQLFNDLGMTLSGAINIFLHQAIEQQGLPFQVRKSRPNRETLAAMKEAIKVAHDPNAKTFSSIEELRKDLEADDEDEAD